ncbi:MAG TPA: hypothetical protein VEU72_03590 [Nitrosopumilaceae archaeon]|nr:hypothetical protein [Nitrosopumilaceae archaeon]
MKYGYAYACISILIVMIGTFLIFQLESTRQTTSLNEIYKPTLSDDQVTQIIRSDLSKHLPNLTKVIIEGKDPIPNNLDYPKHPLRLWYITPNGTQFLINNTNYSVVWKCVPEINFCNIRSPLVLQASSGRLVYLADLSWYTTETHGNGFPTYYLIDANDGEVLFSTLLESANSTKQMIIEYRP